MSIMKFYVFSPVILSKYVSAQDIILPDNIRYHTCEQCGADNQLIWDEFVPCFECETITSRRRLPDLMLYGGRIVNAFGSWFIVSKRFKDFFEGNGFKGAEFYSAKLCFCRRNKFFDIQNTYFVMDITGRADYDFKGMNMEISMCRNCGMYHFDTPHIPLAYSRGTYPSLLSEKSWDGSDVFNQGECTEQFARSVLESDLTGFEFLRFEQKFDKFENKQYIERLSDLVDK